MRRTHWRREPDGLTRMEVAVLQLLSEGLREQGVADELFITRKAVSWHTANIRRKLGMGRTREAVERALAQGIVRDNRYKPAEERI